jgi:hypothetical protein
MFEKKFMEVHENDSYILRISMSSGPLLGAWIKFSFKLEVKQML